MKVTKEQAAANRAAIVDAASKLFRERGFDGVGVAEITKAAGFTHGGFYGHFASKDALAAEASDHAFRENAIKVKSWDLELGLGDYLDRYLCESHRDRRATGCPVAALAGEVDRQVEELQVLFGGGVKRFASLIEDRLPAGEAAGADERHAKALTVASAMVGSLVLARATAVSDPGFSAGILSSVREELRRFARGAEIAPR